MALAPLSQLVSQTLHVDAPTAAAAALGSTCLAATLVLTPRFVLAFFPALELAARRRRAPGLVAALLAADPLLESLLGVMRSVRHPSWGQAPAAPARPPACHAAPAEAGPHFYPAHPASPPLLRPAPAQAAAAGLVAARGPSAAPGRHAGAGLLRCAAGQPLRLRRPCRAGPGRRGQPVSRAA